MTLRQYIGEIPERGAFTRMAEAAGLSVMTVRRIYAGGNATMSTIRRLQDAIHARTPMVAKARKDKGMKRNR